jgi:hypothetical protein
MVGAPLVVAVDEPLVAGPTIIRPDVRGALGTRLHLFPLPLAKLADIIEA